MTGFVIRTELYICVFVEVQAKEEGRAAGFGMHGTLQNASDLTWIMDSGSGDWILGQKRARGMARGCRIEASVYSPSCESEPQNPTQDARITLAAILGLNCLQPCLPKEPKIQSDLQGHQLAAAARILDLQPARWSAPKSADCTRHVRCLLRPSPWRCLLPAARIYVRCLACPLPAHRSEHCLVCLLPWVPALCARSLSASLLSKRTSTLTSAASCCLRRCQLSCVDTASTVMRMS